ncbi:hypothetical protein [Micromonospora sp. NPDC049679]|uniref:hypothetical protein n=1 Tax=Micromonospora sp. NPDC049679 TaxID=3155920 RepID=UPI0033DE43E5
MSARRRRRLAVVLVGAAVAVAPLSSAHAAAKDDGVDLVVPVLAAMLPGQQGWVSALWSANKDICDVKVTVSGPGLTVSYPTNTGTYTSMYINSALATGNIDYTAFNVTVPSSAGGPVPVTLAVSYTQLPPGQIKKDDDLKTAKFDCKGPKGAQTVEATLPVVPVVGAAVAQRTTAVTVPRTKPTWVNIKFQGRKPGLDNFRVTLSPPAGLTLTYPSDATSAGLQSLAGLPVAREDHVSVRLDAGGLAPGDYQVPVHATYTGGSYDGKLTVTVTAN